MVLPSPQHQRRTRSPVAPGPGSRRAGPGRAAGARFTPGACRCPFLNGPLPPRDGGEGLAAPTREKPPLHACPRRGLHRARPAPFLPGTYRAVPRLYPCPRWPPVLGPAPVPLVPPSRPRLHPRVNQIPSLQQPCWAPVRARRSPQEPPAASAGGSAAGLGSERRGGPGSHRRTGSPGRLVSHRPPSPIAARDAAVCLVTSHCYR